MAKHIDEQQKKSFKQAWQDKTTAQRVAFVIKIIIVLMALLFLVLAVFAKELFGEESLMASIMGNTGGASGIGNAIKDRVPVLLKTGTLIIVTLSVSFFVRLILRKILSLGKKGKTIVNLIDSFIKYAAAIILIFLILVAWGVSLSAVIASAGIIGLVVGLGAQSLISDIISGIFIVFEGDFQVGDIIVIDDYRGTVQSIGMRTTRLLTPLGDVKVFNNSDIRNFVNMSKHPSIAISDITMEYMIPIETVEKIISENIDAIGDNNDRILDGPTYLGVASLGEGGVVLRFIAKCHEDDRFQVTRDLNRDLKVLFDRHGICTQPTFIWADPTTYTKPTGQYNPDKNPTDQCESDK